MLLTNSLLFKQCSSSSVYYGERLKNRTPLASKIERNRSVEKKKTSF